MPNRSVVPGRFQRASRTGHASAVFTAIAEDRDFFVPADRVQPLDWLPPRIHMRDDLGGVANSVDKVLAVDGSLSTVEARAGMPSVRYGFVQASAVLIFLEGFKEQRVARFVDPVKLRKAHTDALISLDFPTAGAYLREGLRIDESWREAIFELFKTKAVEVTAVRISLLDQLLALHGTPGSPASEVTLSRCPVESCTTRDYAVPAEGGRCPGCASPVFPTDVLRIAEEVDDHSTNETALGRLMQVVELLVLFALLTLLWRRGRRYLDEVVFLADGPLAVFGTPAKLKGRALSYLQALSTGGGGPYVCGLQKSGPFVDFAEAVAGYSDLAPGSLIEVDDDVISRVVNRDDVSDYGQETYFGRKFFYYTMDGSMLVLTVPPASGHAYGAGVGQSDPGAYPTLGSILSVIDQTGSSMYRNAVVPVALAHDLAAYPIGVGTDVLKLVARHRLGLDRRDDDKS